MVLGAHYLFSSPVDTPDADGFIRYHMPGLSVENPRLGPYLSQEGEGQTNGYAL